jgi:hypothetical protein
VLRRLDPEAGTRKMVLSWFMKKTVFFLLFLGLVIGAWPANGGNGTDDLPHSGEAFPTYFARLTHGGTFPGIYLKASEHFQNSFFQTIQKGGWVRDLDKEIKHLQENGVDIWSDWYKTATPLSLLNGLTPASGSSFSDLLKSESTKQCGSPQSVTTWKDTPLCARVAIVQVIVFGLRDKQGLAIIDHLAKKYDLTADEIKTNTDIFIEGSAGFASRVKQMGYSGQIYFRGITGPDPRNSSRHWVALDHDLMATRTPFTRPLLQMLEYAAILSHELNHVAQDLAARKFGGDVQVRDAESALVIEGMAEYLNEQEWIEFSNQLPTNPFALFSREQGVEIVYREGNETSGSLFPYTIGVPFIAAFYSLRTKDGISTATSRRDLLNVLSGTIPLTDLTLR